MRRTSHGQQKLALLEPLLASLRYRHSFRLIKEMLASGEQVEGFDIGCGFKGDFVAKANLLEGVNFRGGDLEVDDRPELFRFDLSNPGTLPFSPNLVTLHAVLEHIYDPVAVVRYVHSILRPGGYFLLTAPSPAAKPILELLAFRLGLICRTEIEDHKQYFDRKLLLKLLGKPSGPFDEVKHTYFQLGLNNLAICRKL
ncbi:MAG: methyltransferase domain-containing protein [Acidobacteriota bacterium]|nr:class I SAM-dependent methyltransferase [Blastocatellia bacterium]MDW8411449.1 methyltransferase domain-containing protein [Acidobacteriota bacterium]